MFFASKYITFLTIIFIMKPQTINLKNGTNVIIRLLLKRIKGDIHIFDRAKT